VTGQQAPPPIITPPRPQRDQGEAPSGPCPRCDGIPDTALTKLRAALEAKEAHR
jgi:hypothetical protein